jgi:hypothetical protein
VARGSGTAAGGSLLFTSAFRFGALYGMISFDHPVAQKQGDESIDPADDAGKQ